MLVMASLLMADDLYEMGKSLQRGASPANRRLRRPIRSSDGGWGSWRSGRRRLPWTWSIPRL